MLPNVTLTSLATLAPLDIQPLPSIQTAVDASLTMDARIGKTFDILKNPKLHMEAKMCNNNHAAYAVFCVGQRSDTAFCFVQYSPPPRRYSYTDNRSRRRCIAL